ncbi:MAG: hypothetical protein H0V83_06065 [Rubrobacter sp.]|nr:hypothetical protein [Rubrobacter sp.]
MKPPAPIRWSGSSSVVAGLLYFVGYAGMAELLPPVMGNLGGHVTLGLAGLATLPALAGAMVRDAGRSGRLGVAGYVLSSIGATVFSAGNLAEGLWLTEFGTRLFALGYVGLTAGVVLLGFALPRAKVLPAWSVWPLAVGWTLFLPVANSPTIFGFAPFAPSLLAAGMLGAGWMMLGRALWGAGARGSRDRGENAAGDAPSGLG